jgi:PBSX family phage terminase large subunit
MIDFANGKFSPKALQFIRESNARLNIAHGSVRSSKTVNCTVRWLAFLFEAPPGDLMMAGKTIASLQRNVLNDIFDLVGPRYFVWKDRQKGELHLFGRRVHIVGANTSESEERIRGLTLAGAYCDEVSLYPESFMDMLMTRLSVSGAKCFCNCNPDSPAHWFYVRYILSDAIKNKKVFHFTLDDNPNLNPDYIDSLKQTFTGVFYDRFIRGLWVAASGVIYRKFADDPKHYILSVAPPVGDIMFSTIGVDFGGSKSAHAFSCTGFKKGYSGIITLDEQYHRPVDHSAESQWDAVKLTSEFIAFVKKQIAARYIVKAVYVDGAEQVLRLSLERGLRAAGIGIPVQNALKRDVNDRIRFYNGLIGHDKYRVMAHCTYTITALQNAVWNDKKLFDERLDDGTTNIDSLDALEYTTESYQKQLLTIATIVAGGQKHVA